MFYSNKKDFILNSNHKVAPYSVLIERKLSHFSKSYTLVKCRSIIILDCDTQLPPPLAHITFLRYLQNVYWYDNTADTISKVFTNGIWRKYLLTSELSPNNATTYKSTTTYKDSSESNVTYQVSIVLDKLVLSSKNYGPFFFKCY